MDHLIAGERSPKVLAQLARARARRKLAELEEALEGAEFFTAEHAALLAATLARINRVNAEIARLSEVIERLLALMRSSCSRQNRRPAGGAAPPGRARRDRYRHDPVPDRRAPGLLGRAHPAGQLLRQAQGEGQVQEGQPVPRRPARRDRHRRWQDPDREGARYRRLPSRRGKAKALVAVGNTELKVYHALLSSPGMRYEDLGPDYYERRAEVSRQVRHHVGSVLEDIAHLMVVDSCSG